MRAGDRMDLDDAVLTDLNDRPDGVALMVEALAQDHALGRFRDFIRVFERAFARPAKTLTDPVVAFLDPRLGYTDAEVKLWFEQYRDPATHADARNDFALEADAQPFIDRMEQAAMDVLMNKRDWRDPSADRRSTWIPMAGTSGPGGDIFVTKGSAGSIQARILDPYGAYPMDLAGVISTPPANWWPAADGNPSKDDDSGAKTAGE
jgi:hypothetical protein